MIYSNEEKAVANLSEALALELGISPKAARLIRNASVFHDIGKDKLPHKILNKPGPLDEQEFEIVKTHTVIGAEMLRSLQGDLGEMARLIARYHHEYYDGGGYWGVHMGNLPGYVAIVSIADVYIALTSERVYKHAWPQGDALEYIKSKAGTQFKLSLVDAFVSLITQDCGIPASSLGGDKIARGA